MAESPSNIRTLYAAAKTLSQQLENLETTSQIYQDKLRDAISSFEECRSLADQVSLFSPNETEDDISSGDLQYLSIDYHLGELIQKNTSSARKTTLQRAREAYERYLGLLDTYGMISKSDRKLYERYQDNREAFSLLASSDLSARRDTKIARYKQEQELKQKLVVRTYPTINRLPRTHSNEPYSTSPKTNPPSKTTIRPSDPSTELKSNSTPTTPSTPSTSYPKN